MCKGDRRLGRLKKTRWRTAMSISGRTSRKKQRKKEGQGRDETEASVASPPTTIDGDWKKKGEGR